MPRRRSYSRDEFLELKPKRRDFRWIEEDGKIRIIVPKFRSRIGRSFCRLLGKEENFTANLDEKGSIIWKLCDGRHTVRKILEELQQRYPEEKDLDQRLFLYLYNLKKLGYITY